MHTLWDTVQYFLLISAELTVLFLGVSTLVSLLLAYIPPDRLRQWLSKRGALGYILAASMGAMTPFCACSTIPLTQGLLTLGAPFGPIMTFVLASPLLNPIIIAMLWTIMGLEACLIYFITTFFGSIIFGSILKKIGGTKYVKAAYAKPSCCCEKTGGQSPPKKFAQKLKGAFISAWSDFTGILPYLLAGVAIGAVIYGYIPNDFVIKVAGPANPFAIPVAATIGIPLYIRAETAIPIGMALVQKGMNMGAVIALIIGGAGMAIPEMTMLAGIFKKRLVFFIALAVWLTAVLAGYFFTMIA